MSSGENTAEVVDMADARRRLSDAPGAEYRDAGEWLGGAREAKGLTLVEAAARTHIKERHLEAIEALDLEALPARPYVIGFVKGYAELLELDVAAVVDRFKEEVGYASAKPVAPEIFETHETSVAIEKPELSLIAVIAILAFVLWCAWLVTLPRDVKYLSETAPQTSAPAIPSENVSQTSTETDTIEARLIDEVEPIYPINCVNGAGPAETVTVIFNISPQGRVSGERTATSTNACFNEAALNAVRRWRFEPRKVNNVEKTAYDQRFELIFERPL
ncbi:MAG: TonB family protein [Pseudomonadota bacterium]